MLKRQVLSLLVLVCLSSCEFTKTVIPINTVTPLAPDAAASPASVTTTIPGEITQMPVLALPSKAPLPTIAPASTGSSCRPSDVLAGIRRDFPYEYEGKKPVVAVTYFFYQDLHAIVVWFQDASLDAAAPQTEVGENAALAGTHASQVTASLLRRDPCIKELFSTLDVIVVDSSDNGWFSGEIVLEKIPADFAGGKDTGGATPAEGSGAEDSSAEDSGAEDSGENGDVQAMREMFESVYLRDKPVIPPSESAQCIFSEARSKIKSHFSDGRQTTANLDFYMVVDEGLATIYAQWTGDNDPANNVARVMSVALELQCLTSPKIDAILFTVVDKRGSALAAGKMPGDAIAKLDASKIEYQKVQ